MLILGIETSCDETAAAVVKDGREVLSSVVATQIEEHRLYGGVVPEIASRRHTESIVGVVDEALKNAHTSLSEIDAIAVTYAPGLIGALLVGVNFAKAVSVSTGKPLIPVHHIRGHVAANYIAYEKLEPPFMALVASGGHSHIVKVEDYTSYKIIGRTRDDAAGEAFDKAARALGFPYPGGVYIDRASVLGDPDKVTLPTPKVADGEFDFSFSGLKTAVVNLIHNAEQRGEEIDKNDVAAAFQKTAVNSLVDTLCRAATVHGEKKIVIAGGVSANSGLRAAASDMAKRNGFELYLPPKELCGDNAAMIASQGYFEYKDGKTADASLNGYATMSIEEDGFLKRVKKK